MRERTLQQENRAWDRYNAAWQEHEDAVAAVQVACNAVKHECELHDRMERWLARPNCLTPFPWPGVDFVEPCNQFDLDYYSGRPDAYPPGVREWQERFESYVYDGPCMCEHEYDSCCVCCPDSE